MDILEQSESTAEVSINRSGAICTKLSKMHPNAPKTGISFICIIFSSLIDKTVARLIQKKDLKSA